MNGRQLGNLKSRIPTPERLEREAKVLELRQQGLSFTKIAAELGTSDRGGAHKLYQSALARVHAEPAAEIRELENTRLDKLLESVWAEALSGNLYALDRVIRIMERRAKLLGLDHEHGIAERSLALEADRIRLIAVALGRALDVLELSPEQRATATRVLLTELRAQEAEFESAAGDVVEGVVVEDDQEPDEASS